MNPLLQRQIDKLIKINPELLKDIKPLLNAVNDSYDNYEDQLSMSQRAMRISSDELFQAPDSYIQPVFRQAAGQNRRHRSSSRNR